MNSYKPKKGQKVEDRLPAAERILESWSDDDIERRWHEVVNDFEETSKAAQPFLKKLIKLENEIFTLKREILIRGMNVDDTKENP